MSILRSSFVHVNPHLRFPPHRVASQRLLSTTAKQRTPKHEWLVILPDHEGILAKRMSVRPKHLQELQPKIDVGFWTFGGGILSKPLAENEGPQIKGSVMLASADTEAEVIEQLKRDTYFASGVWDWDKVQIFPFNTALRKGLRGGD